MPLGQGNETVMLEENMYYNEIFNYFKSTCVEELFFRKKFTQDRNDNSIRVSSGKIWTTCF